MLTEVNAADFQAAVAESSAVVLKVSAPWCSTCKAVAPMVKSVANSVQDVKFYEINADTNVDFVADMGIKSLPTFVFYKDGQKMFQEKALTESLFRKKLDQLKG